MQFLLGMDIKYEAPKTNPELLQPESYKILPTELSDSVLANMRTQVKSGADVHQYVIDHQLEMRMVSYIRARDVEKENERPEIPETIVKLTGFFRWHQAMMVYDYRYKQTFTDRMINETLEKMGDLGNYVSDTFFKILNINGVRDNFLPEPYENKVIEDFYDSLYVNLMRTGSVQNILTAREQN